MQHFPVRVIQHVPEKALPIKVEQDQGTAVAAQVPEQYLVNGVDTDGRINDGLERDNRRHRGLVGACT